MKFLLYIFYRFAAFLLGTSIFILGGAMLGFFILALKPVSDVSTYSLESSRKLAEFLDNKSTEVQTFTESELNSGVLTIFNDAASSMSKKRGTSLALPVAPSLALSGSEISVSIPVSVDLILHRADTRIVFTIGFCDGIQIRGARVGAAKLPSCIALQLADVMLEPYSDIEALEKYISAIEKIDSASFSANSVSLKK